MNTARISDRRLVWLAWGVFFIWWGMVDSDFGILEDLPRGTGWFGIGLVLVGLNVARWRVGNPVGVFSLSLGLLALALGGLKLTGFWPYASIEVSFLALVTILVGVAMLTCRGERS